LGTIPAPDVDNNNTECSSISEQSVSEERKDPVQVHNDYNIADPRIAELEESNKDLTFNNTRLEMEVQELKQEKEKKGNRRGRNSKNRNDCRPV
jgi:hypothetical protein